MSAKLKLDGADLGAAKLFRNTKGTYFASFVDVDGKRRYISLKTTDRETAEQAAIEAVPHHLCRVQEPLPKEVSRYIEAFRPLRSNNWNRDADYILRAWADEMSGLGCNCVQQITAKTLQAWFRNKAQKLKIATVAGYLIRIRHFLGWCKNERRLVLFNAADKVIVPRHNKPVRRNFLSLKDAQRLIDHAVDEELRFGLFCALHAGMRFGEVMMARPEWFNLERKLIHIQVSPDWGPKNGSERVIPMTNEFHAFLEHYGLREPFMIAPLKRCVASSRYRFDFSRRFDRLIRELGINCTFHDLRRTFASLKVSSSVSIYKVAKWCGHGVGIAERHYGHLIPADDEINVGLERREPAPVVAAPEVQPHRQLTWEELHELVWSKPLTRGAREVGISDQGLRKMCHRMQVPLPPQGYWNCPPDRRAEYLERFCRDINPPKSHLTRARIL
jgi:integrase